MRRWVDLMAMFLGGWIGWEAGAWHSVFTGYMTSVVGTGMGLWFGRRFLGRLIP